MQQRTLLGTAHLIGRTAELAELQQSVLRAAAGTGNALLLRGPGGVGKSRLIKETIAFADGLGVQVFAGRAFEVEAEFPYAIMGDAFPAYFQERADQVADLLAPAPTTKARLFQTFLSYLLALAAEGPVMVVLDDIHWADPASLELLHYITRHAARAQLLLLLGCRSDEEVENEALQGIVSSLTRSGHLSILPLTPLSLAETAEMTRQLLQMESPPSDEFSRMLYSETGGNPFFLEEILKSMVQNRVLYQQEGQWRRRPLATLGVPTSIRDTILSRLSRLSADARRILDTAAIIGARFTYTALQAALNMDEAALLDTLDHFVRIQLLKESPGTSAGEILYTFAHPKIQEVICGDLSLARRRVVHGQVALRLEALYGADADAHADELARHFALSGQGDLLSRSIAYDIRAGDRAFAMFAYPRAAALYLRALTHHEEAGSTLDHHRLYRVLVNLGLAYERMGDFTAAAEFWDQALAIGSPFAGPAEQAELYAHLARAHWQHEDTSRALAYTDQGLALLAEAGLEGTPVAALHHERFQALMMQGRAEEAEATALAAITAARWAGNRASEAIGQVRLSILALVRNDPHECIRQAAPALAILPDVPGAEVALAQAHILLAWSYWTLGQPQEARGQVERALQMNERYGLFHLGSEHLEVLALLHFQSGEWEAARAAASEVLDRYRQLQKHELIRPLCILAMVQSARGELGAARALCEEAEQILGPRGGPVTCPMGELEPYLQIAGHCLLLRTYLLQADWANAHRHGSRAAALMEQTGYAGYVAVPQCGVLYMSEALAHLNQPEEAIALLERVRQYCGETARPFPQQVAHRTAGLIARARGRGPAAYDAFLKAHQANQEAGTAFDGAHDLVLAASVAPSAGEGRRLLQEALESFRRLGAAAEVEVESLLGSPRRPRRTDGLSSRELEIVRQVCQHKTDKEIAATLYISVRTVTTHLGNIYRKLEMRSRTELVQYALEQGLDQG